ncbi:bilirubin oxidase [Zopfia rhizophila CBS 207.26]|uniref:Bilirubin oxidase n=1 Tax=Zopfia rhizophila CBS 207.26 TaxID=1314779 RepID=A0A6A6DUL3_9PEZI|nr:bilirubin oxidase [Zopfia rhizophila CBS 207.26]
MFSNNLWGHFYICLFLIDISVTANSTVSQETSIANTTVSRGNSIPRPTGQWISPEYKWFFEYPLPIAPIYSPKLTYTNASTKAIIDYYEVEVKRFQQQIYPNLKPTELVGYDGQSPGPMFMMQKGREAVVRFSNHSPGNISVHVHGQYNRAPFDGWAADTAHPGQYKDYYYPNGQNARTIWYHDHSEFVTGENVYRGQEGFYIITDAQEQSLELPSGNYDVTISLQSKMYNPDGSLLFDTDNNTGLLGDVIQANGQPWPYFNVEPRKYRLRLLDGSVSRIFNLSFAVDGSNGKHLPFDVIASDAGLLSYPVKTQNLILSMGERYEIIIDFAELAGQNITMRNTRDTGENIDHAATDMVMLFVVSETVTDQSNNGDPPSNLRNILYPPDKVEADKDFTFERVGDEWLINGVGFADVEHRILTNPPRGAVEIWNLHNGNGDGTHPVHIHLVDFQVLSRRGGRNRVFPYEAAGMKDVVFLAGGETVRVVARYAPWDGVYMFHCHNLVHEDHDMLVAFNVTSLAKWGYDNSTHFINPMEPEFRPKDIKPEDFTEEAIMKKLEWFYNTDAYEQSKEYEIVSALDSY